MGYVYIFGTIFFTVYGQLVIKWRVAKYGDLPSGLLDKVLFLFNIFLDPYVISGFLSAFIASFFWMAVMTKFELSYAYPFMSLAFVFVFVFSAFFFNESISFSKIFGLMLIVIGILVVSRSK